MPIEKLCRIFIPDFRGSHWKQNNVNSSNEWRGKRKLKKKIQMINQFHQWSLCRIFKCVCVNRFRRWMELKLQPILFHKNSTCFFCMLMICCYFMNVSLLWSVLVDESPTMMTFVTFKEKKIYAFKFKTEIETISILCKYFVYIRQYQQICLPAKHDYIEMILKVSACSSSPHGKIYIYHEKKIFSNWLSNGS